MVPAGDGEPRYAARHAHTWERIDCAGKILVEPRPRSRVVARSGETQVEREDRVGRDPELGVPELLDGRK